MRLLFLNGPNANLYGHTAKGTYGGETFEDIGTRCHAKALEVGASLDFRQSQSEGELVEWIQQARPEGPDPADGIIINAAGLSYTSIAILDALLAFPGPVIEVHMSNIHRREPFRHKTYTAQAAVGSICGLGPLGYELAIEAMAGLVRA
ncbi:3-dehydroquinate dehydratase [Rhodovarius crocodyli]|uniref:3-dehydroquinate dehydratase n=1 Tax=Rhodovarius crocodyli TaxID=1979269 RepID=A0A437MJH3_9PROT|nr:type II 3-dehydroquinate dehydratase [Rhodovarius crocodyli]RVT97800.1 3-dehydroquinate dehydratase [Rhodovarius crocodyli]